MFELSIGSKTKVFITPQEVADEVSKLNDTCYQRGQIEVNKKGHTDFYFAIGSGSLDLPVVMDLTYSYRTIEFKSDDPPEKIAKLIRKNLPKGGHITMIDCYPGGCP